MGTVTSFGRSGAIIALSVLLLLSALLPLPMAAGPDHSASDVKVKGEGKEFPVTVVVQAKVNGTYHVEIAEVESVTHRFDLVDNGTSEKKALGPGITYNFQVTLRTRQASVGQTSSIPYEIYQNDVLVAQGSVNITVEADDPASGDGLTCSGCSLVIPLSIAGGGLFIVGSRRRALRYSRE